MFHQIKRRVKVTRGRLALRMTCAPAFNYGRTPHRTDREAGRIISFTTPELSLSLLSDSMVYRYNTARTDDGVNDPEGTFNICTFWLVDAICRVGSQDPDRVNKSRLIFESMLNYSNHLGLFSEETATDWDTHCGAR